LLVAVAKLLLDRRYRTPVRAMGSVLPPGRGRKRA